MSPNTPGGFSEILVAVQVLRCAWWMGEKLNYGLSEPAIRAVLRGVSLLRDTDDAECDELPVSLLDVEAHLGLCTVRVLIAERIQDQAMPDARALDSTLSPC